MPATSSLPAHHLPGTWFVLGVLIVLFMRQNVVSITWWAVLPLAAAATHLLGESSVPGLEFALFFSRYLLFGILATATVLRFVPASLSAELPEVLFRVGLLRR